MEAQPLRVVPRAEGPHRIGRHRGQRGNVGQEPAIRPSEPERAVGVAIDLIAFLVDRAVMPPTEQREIGERRRTASCPMTDVMALGQP